MLLGFSRSHITRFRSPSWLLFLQLEDLKNILLERNISPSLQRKTPRPVVATTQGGEKGDGGAQNIDVDRQPDDLWGRAYILLRDAKDTAKLMEILREHLTALI